MKKFLLGLFCGVLLMACSAVYASDTIQTYLFPVSYSFNEGLINNMQDNTEYTTLNYNGHAYVPIRFIAEHMGAYVNYDDTKKRINIFYFPRNSTILTDNNYPNVHFGIYRLAIDGGHTLIKGLVSLDSPADNKSAAADLQLNVKFYDQNNKLLGTYNWDSKDKPLQPKEIRYIMDSFPGDATGYSKASLEITHNKGHQTEATNTNTGESDSANVNLTDNEVKDILNGLIPKAVDNYGMFNGAGYFKIDPTKTIPGEENYCLVTGVNGKPVNDTTNVKSIADLKKVIEDVFTKDTAQKLFYSRYLTPEKDSSFYKDYEGNLYEDMNHGGHGWATKFLVDTAKIKSQKDNVVEIALDTTVLDDPYGTLIIKIEYVNGKWLMASGLDDYESIINGSVK